VPGWPELTEDEQLAVIRAEDAPVTEADALHLRHALARTRANLELIRNDLADGVARYVHTLVALLAQAGLAPSPRRAGMLFRAVLAVNAATLAIDPATAAADATLLAVENALPQRAQGIAISRVKLLAAHRDAWRLANVAAADPLRAILCTADPVERLRLALATPKLPKGEFSRVVADTLARLPPGAREAAIAHLFETGTVGRLNAAVAGQAAEVYRDIATPPEFSETLHATHTRFKTWAKVKDLLARLDPADPRAHLHANALAAAFARKQLATPEDAEHAFHAYAAAEARFAGA